MSSDPIRLSVAGFLLLHITGIGASAIELKDELEMLSRREQVYTLKFSARPDAQHFQIQRLATAKWPQRASFYLRVGETSNDQQFRVDSIEEKTEMRSGIEVDVSELQITHLASGTKHILKKSDEYSIPTSFAEFRATADPSKSIYVREGAAFDLEAHPGLQFKLLRVDEDSSRIEIFKDGKSVGEQEIEKQ